jgi:hypothetical protein
LSERWKTAFRRVGFKPRNKQKEGRKEETLRKGNYLKRQALRAL